MDKNLKIPSPWSQLALFLILIGGALVVAAGVIVLIPGVHQGQLPTGGPLKLAQAVTSTVLFGLPSICFGMLVFRHHPLEQLGFRPAVKNSFYLVAVLLLFFSFPMEGWLGMLNKQIPLPHWMVSMEDENEKQMMAILAVKGPLDIIINLLVVAVIPGIFEEMCFRGVLQRIMIHIFKNPWAGIVATGLLFSAFHMEFEGFLPRTFLGILLGAAYWYSGSLWTPIIAHTFFNGIQVLAAGWYPKVVTENPSVPVYSALISLVIVVGLLAYMRRQSTVTYAQIYQPISE